MSFTDFSALQRDCAHVLLSDAWLNDVKVAMRHELLEETALARLPDRTLAAEVLVYLTPRNKASGRKGCGIIVERPEFSVNSPNVSGPQGNIIIEFLVLADRLQNESLKSGTLRIANHVGQRILDLFHHFALGGAGTWKAEGNALQAASDWEPLDAWRVRLTMVHGRAQTARCQPVAIAIADGLCTLTCATADAQIYFTAGGQDAAGNWLEPGMPAPSNTGGGAQLYSEPFPVAAGQIIRACAFKENLNQGPVQRTIAP